MNKDQTKAIGEVLDLVFRKIPEHHLKPQFREKITTSLTHIINKGKVSELEKLSGEAISYRAEGYARMPYVIDLKVIEDRIKALKEENSDG